MFGNLFFYDSFLKHIKKIIFVLFKIGLFGFFFLKTILDDSFLKHIKYYFCVI